MCPPRTRLPSFFFYCYRDHRDLHSFPTRRSSDLLTHEQGFRAPGVPVGWVYRVSAERQRLFPPTLAERRSEEHTSELQSRGHLVCRLLLEKKKTKKKTTEPPTNQTNTHIYPPHVY